MGATGTIIYIFGMTPCWEPNSQPSAPYSGAPMPNTNVSKNFFTHQVVYKRGMLLEDIDLVFAPSIRSFKKNWESHLDDVTYQQSIWGKK